jgi:hypothetical protein
MPKPKQKLVNVASATRTLESISMGSSARDNQIALVQAAKDDEARGKLIDDTLRKYPIGKITQNKKMPIGKAK